MTKAGSRGDNEAHRAEILRLLVPQYPTPLTFGGLQQALVINGHPMTSKELVFHVTYMEEAGYLKLERDTRRGLSRILSTAATKKGVDLHDGRIPEDPGIAL
jgi:hypothetical protein